MPARHVNPVLTSVINSPARSKQIIQQQSPAGPGREAGSAPHGDVCDVLSQEFVNI